MSTDEDADEHQQLFALTAAPAVATHKTKKKMPAAAAGGAKAGKGQRVGLEAFEMQRCGHALDGARFYRQFEPLARCAG